jgi:hypothetical protein
VQEFNGLTEMGFPQSFVDRTRRRPGAHPAAAGGAGVVAVNPIEFEKHESA